MTSDHTSDIEHFFQSHADDGEFLRYGVSAPYSVVGIVSRVESGRYVITTKPTPLLAAFSRTRILSSIGIIGRYGLPNRSDIDWILRAVGEAQLFFLGDMDPVDLLVFSWLRTCLGSSHITYLGVPDIITDSLRTPSWKSVVIPFSASEQAAMPLLLKVYPDIHEVVGDKCAKLLMDHRKIEIEGLLGIGRQAIGRLLTESR